MERIAPRRVAIVLPTFNEIENLAECISGIQKYAPNADIYVVDDKSPDGTGKLADQLASKNPRITVLHRPKKEGLGRAYISAFKILLKDNYDTILQMDVDGSHRPKDIPKLLGHANQNHLVIGSRWVKGGSVEQWPLRRLILSRFANFYVATLLRLKIKDSTAGFRAYSTTLLRQIDLDGISSQGYSFQIEMTFAASKFQASIKEVPIAFIERQQGHSKMSLKVIIEAVLAVPQLALSQRKPK